MSERRPARGRRSSSTEAGDTATAVTGAGRDPAGGTAAGTTKRRSLAVGILVVVALLAASSGIVETGAGRDRAPVLADGSVTVVSDEGVPRAVSVSRSLFDSATEAVVVPAGAAPADIQRGAEIAERGRLPMFTVDDAGAPAVADELGRLGVRRVIGVGGVTPDLDVPVENEDAADDGASAVPSASAAQKPTALVLDDDRAVVATAESAGVTVVPVPVADPRANGASVAALKSDVGAPVLAFGAEFGTQREMEERIALARSVPELSGGGQIMFPGRRIVALYGSPGVPALGPLGVQGIDASIKRARRAARKYDKISDAPVVPAFEIIATVASADPGFRGQYTNVVDPNRLRPWVDAAREAGVYVTLDLQPGRMDFLTQAKMYRDLLLEPHVGLALDPEWRLKPDQKHLTQIGAVEPAEVNRTSDWLAGLVRDNHLPQKAFVLHQFDAAMLGDRSKLDVSHPELATVVHADGHGIPSVKMQTWRRIVNGLPPNVWLGWKNFYTEDTPMFSPARTLRVRPEPWFISYQ